jgi:F-type H+-transporting ATPase subunit b
MLVDWFTVGAQIVNFLVLMALLKIFLYDRVIRAMDEREEKIHSRLEDADQKKEEARRKAEDLEEERRRLEEKRGEMISEARRQADDRRRELEEKAHREVERMQSQWRESIGRQRRTFVKDLQQMACRQIYAAAGKALHDLADDELEARILSTFADKLQHMAPQRKKELGAGDGAVVVRSAFEIGSTERGKMTRLLHREIAEDLEVEYRQDPEILAGVEVKAGGRKIAWNLRDYLKPLEEKTVKALDRQAERDGPVKPGKPEKHNGEPEAENA